jgi:hypothetical protein
MSFYLVSDHYDPQPKGLDPNPEYNFLSAYVGMEHNLVIDHLSKFVRRFGNVTGVLRDHGFIYMVTAQVNDDMLYNITKFYMAIFHLND